MRRGDITLGDLVVVVGCGPVGLMAVLSAVGAAGRVLAVDSIPARRELAARLEAEPVEPGEAREVVNSARGGLGADLVIEAAGAVSIVGAHVEPDYPLNNGLMFERELTLRFTIGDPIADRERLLGLIAMGRMDPTQIITRRMPLDAAQEAYRLFDNREATKVILQP
jgi:threonine dehydrogenase-like Zn-dependent dehydrogenase